MTSRQPFRPLFFALVLALAALSFSSCNRGYGCPNNFSIDLENTVEVLRALPLNPQHD